MMQISRPLNLTTMAGDFQCFRQSISLDRMPLGGRIEQLLELCGYLMLIFRILIVFVLTVGSAYSSDRVIGVGQIAESSLYNQDLRLTMSVEPDGEGYLDVINVEVTNMSDVEYRVALPGDISSLAWGLFITDMESRSELLDREGIVMDYESEYVIHQLPSGGKTSWRVDARALAGGFNAKMPLIQKARVSLRFWVFRLEDGESLSFLESEQQSTRLVWFGSPVR